MFQKVKSRHLHMVTCYQRKQNGHLAFPLQRRNELAYRQSSMMELQVGVKYSFEIFMKLL